MNKLDDCIHCDHFSATIEAAHQRALRALNEERAPLDTVIWLSAHLAAVDRVVLPAVRRHVPDTDAAIKEQEKLSTEMQHALRMLEQLLAGDALARRHDRAQLTEAVAALLSTHASGEHKLLDALARAIGPEDAARLEERYERAISDGPTRPHPHSAHEGITGRAQFFFNRARDHVMDVLDARHVPIPRRRRPAPSNGKWGSYLLGTQHTPER
ncbi:MAG TPA: hypothetical protein VFH54_00500 [Mycobacteriales bacterium]|nr:hypothetical protein [Mycobacteriales bacterium]